MLPYALAVHPDTTESVLGVLANCDHPYAATISRLRLGHELPQHQDHVGLTPTDLAALLHRPGITPEQRRSIVHALPANEWVAYLRSHLPTAEDLTEFADHPQAVAPVIAAHPHTPHDIAVRMLDQAIGNGQIQPATVLAIMDTHQIAPTELRALNWISAGAASYQTTIRYIVDRYQRAGSLINYMRPAHRKTRSPEQEVSWAEMLAVTSNHDLIVHHLDLHSPSVAAVRTMLRNPNLPISAQLPISLYEDTVTPQHSSQLFAHLGRAFTAHPDPSAEPVLDILVKRATQAPNLIVTFATHPYLTAGQLTTLAELLPATLDIFTLIDAATAITTHPNTPTDARDLARDSLPHEADLDEIRLPPVSRARLAIARGHSPRVADLPDHPTSSDLTTINAYAAPALRAHPNLHTSPDLVCAALALLPEFHGTIEQLITTATTITGQP